MAPKEFIKDGITRTAWTPANEVQLVADGWHPVDGVAETPVAEQPAETPVAAQPAETPVEESTDLSGEELGETNGAAS